jgi:hypothetical protein
LNREPFSIWSLALHVGQEPLHRRWRPHLLLAAAPAAYSASAASYRSQAARRAACSSRRTLGDFGGPPLLMKAPQRARLQEREDLRQQVRQHADVRSDAGEWLTGAAPVRTTKKC